jgi:hypothetical protein
MNIDDVRVGRRVCLVGFGTTATLHEHTYIDRLTPTMIVMKNGRRFRRGEPFTALPRREYGGITIHTDCPKRFEK